MKLLLIQPPIQDFYDTDIRLQPLGLACLKAAVKRHFPGIEVIIKDYHQGHGRRTIALPAELSYLKEYYAHHDSSPFSTFHHYYHFGADFDLISRETASEKPDLVGISVLFSPYFREALACAGEIKKRLNVPILTGGSHVAAAPLSMLRDPSVDFVIRGEGEKPLVAFLEEYTKGRNWQKVPNLGFKKNGKAVLNPLGDPEPFDKPDRPDFTDFPKERYLFKKQPLCFMAASRGCPHGCSFCSVQTTFGRAFRQRLNDDILAEIAERYAEGYRVFDFEDDNLSFYQDNFKDLLKRLIEIFPEKDVRLTAMNGISYLSLDREILDLMRRAGFTDLNIALVSVNRRVLTELGRPHSLDKYNEVVADAYLVGLNIVSYQILGLPQENLDEMIDTLTVLSRQPVLIGASVFYLTPACPLANRFPELSEVDFFKARSSALAVETGDFKRHDLYTLFVLARILNFIKGIQTAESKLALPQALGILEKADERSGLGVEILRRLFREQKLHAATPQGFKPLLRFKSSLFFKAWRKIGFVTARQGSKIELGF